ncbi:MAG: transcription antitermination factor NusB [Acidobacteriota bacterium]
MPPRPAAERGARSEAVAILLAVDEGRDHSHRLLRGLPEGMDKRERGLVTELVYGVLRRRRALDRVIARYAVRPPGRIDPFLLNALRIALYQILFLTRIPRASAVDESVRLVLRSRGRALASFANAVLRAACRGVADRGAAAVLAPSPSPDPARSLSEAHSFPLFLVRRFVRRYGTAGAEALLETLNRPAPIVLRPVRLGAAEAARRLAREGVVVAPSPVLPGALRVVRGSPRRTRLFGAGRIYIQDEASQLVGLLAVPPRRPGASLLDMCSAPGGKILMIAERSRPDQGPTVAADVGRARMRLLDENLSRAGVAHVHKVIMDSALPALRARFDSVLLDAPCSGTGIIRRRPEIRWRRTEASIRDFALKQARLLDAGVSLLRPGGHLVYAVCSLEPEEGPAQIERCLERHPGLRAIDPRPRLPEAARRMVDGHGFLVTLPHRDDTDGFFAALIRLRA